MHATRAFARKGLFGRTAPFIGVALGAAASLAFTHPVDTWDLWAGVASIGVLIVAIFTVPWERLPRWTDAVVPMLFFVAVVFLRDAEGGQTASTGSLVLLPVVWFGLFGTKREVIAGVVGALSVFALPAILIGAPRYPASELAKAFNLCLVASMVGYVVYRLVAALTTLTAEVTKRADTDSLTGLPNRGAWIRRLDEAVARAASTHEPLCVAIIDMDGLKAINDAGGHQAGDRAIIDASDAWSASAPAAAMLARLGGDEFGLILPGLSGDQALVELDTLRRAALPYASSFGLAEYHPPESARLLLGRADNALYAAKTGGRNRTSVAARQVADELRERESSPYVKR